MKKPKSLLSLFILFCFVSVAFYGVFFARQRGIPFVTKKVQWTIGVIRGKTPFSFTGPFNWFNPIFRAEDVTDVQASFVADPFLIREAKLWYLFFEVYDVKTKQGELAVATSTNTWKWNYKQVILDEPFHLSFPYVFKWENDYYLIPESFEAKSIRLYKADNFPTKWSFVKTLVEGKDYVDNTIVHFHDKWWLFTSTTACDTLYVYYADDLLGPWTEHPKSPVVKGNTHIARPAGRLLVYDDQLYRFTMDVNPPFGNHQVTAFKVTDITPTAYSEEMVPNEPILKGSGKGWNGQGMHQIDPVQVKPDEWIASVDGYGEYYVFDWRH